MTSEVLRLAEIRSDGGTQSRARLELAVIAEYAECMRHGANFPPVVVYYDGQAYWLADGFHRVAGALQAGQRQINRSHPCASSPSDIPPNRPPAQ